MKRSPELLRLADSVLLPGFEGRTPPDWLRRRLGEGLPGVVLFSRNVVDLAQLAELTAALRAERPDAVIGIDEETGDVTRLEVRDGSSRPGNYALGVVDDVALTEEIARGLGDDLAAAGVNVDFAPSADVNSNFANPVIGLRSFGADPALVARHTAAWIRGLQAAGVAACAKHFPGHGDTAVDSHHGLPAITATGERLHEVELLPFKAAIAEGVRMIMTGHLLTLACDPELPATLSHRVLTGLLRNELGFQGVIITDAIEMAAVAGRYGIGGASAMAVAAGADLVCVGGENADDAVVVTIREAVADAVAEGRLPEDRLAEAAERVSALTAWSGALRPAGAVDGAPAGAPAGLAAARRAIRINGPEGGAPLPLTSAPHVVELSPPMNLAIDKNTPWGISRPLVELLPGTTVARFDEQSWTATAHHNGAVLHPAAGRPLVVVVRDAHRHPWQAAALARLLEARPDAIVVEMGLPGRTDLGAVHIATHGAARVSGQAAAEALTGRLDAVEGVHRDA
ncbi:glycoside hydrolase family 3 N-terminal domain-containing protein [Sphaerisporangium sp. TRM90804]|uniref:glycoside hydrolase family 3 protein n=1 Tax=Sphaerisporangium sp. TRM90804 TaxID=3031113 RepID=UPI00244860D5|nr:glycoside hydrolase family 3 N-terminal domain-containing protein [Sphaerisporangium sp. TRM90804]MDH2425220.1 glycoside hydrolase family 3 N-terminal domain-containing protein [Sphaerisporangium sp. TRM90804]